MIDTLIFSGGGVAGISFIGTLSAIENNYDLKNIKTIIGSSSGSVIGLMISLGYTSRQLTELILNIDLSTLINISDDFCNDFLNNFGMDHGEKLLNLLIIFLKNKYHKKDITFKELYEHYNIELVITGTCINKHRVDYFNYHDNPDMSVLKAVRISISIPFYFTSPKIDDNIYADGGIIDNYPIGYKYLRKDNFLGFNLYSKIYEKETILNVQDYIHSIITCIRKKTSTINIYNSQTIEIDYDVNLMDFTIGNEIKQKLITNGYNKTLDYFNSNVKYDISNIMFQNDHETNNILEDISKTV